MLKLQVVGCSSGTPHPRLAGSSYLLMQDDRRILFDAGEGLSAALRRTKVDPLSIDTIFISHLHSDHVSGLFLYLQYMHGMRRKEPLDIFVPSEAEEPIKMWLTATYLFPDRLSLPLEIHPIDADFEFEMTDLKIMPHPTSHLESKKSFVKKHGLPNELQCYSYIIEPNDRRIVYSADLGALEDIVSVIDEADLLIIEGLHIDLQQLPQLAVEKKVKQIMLTHLPEDFDESAARMRFSKVGFENLLFAHEGLEIDFE